MNEYMDELKRRLEQIVRLADGICADYKELDTVSLSVAKDLQSRIDAMQEELDAMHNKIYASRS